MTNPTDGLLADGGDQPTHRVVGKAWRWGDDVYEPGDLVAPPETALEIHAPRFERLDEAPESADGDESEPEDEPMPSPAAFSVSELEDELDGIDDVDTLEAMLAAERDGDNRTTAVAAIESRLDEVTE